MKIHSGILSSDHFRQAASHWCRKLFPTRLVTWEARIKWQYQQAPSPLGGGILERQVRRSSKLNLSDLDQSEVEDDSASLHWPCGQTCSHFRWRQTFTVLTGAVDW